MYRLLLLLGAENVFFNLIIDGALILNYFILLEMILFQFLNGFLS